MITKSGIYFESVGEGDPLVLISGLNADRSFWVYTVDYFKRHFNVITIDNRGVGESNIFAPECTTKLMAEDVVDVLDCLKIETANIVGHSLGGCVAQMFAIHYSERIRKLVLCSTHAKLNDLRKLLIENNLAFMRNNIPRELIIKNAMVWLFSDRFLANPKNRENFANNALRIPLETARKSYFYQANALLQHDSSSVIDQIKCPTLIICGEEDMIAPIKNSYYLAQKIHSAGMISIADAAHMLPIENSKQFFDYVVNFLL